MNSYNKFNCMMMNTYLQNSLNNQEILYYYYINQFNRPYYISQNYNLNNYQKKNFLIKKNNKRNVINRNKFKEDKENIPLNKANNIFEKINNIKMSYRKKNSVNTIICDSSFSSFSPSESDEEIIEEINENIISKKPKKDKRKRLSFISEGISDTSECTSNTSFYSKEKEKIEKENKNENKSNNTRQNIISKEYKVNCKFENTEILRVNVKISKDKIAVFKLKRFDDIFETIKLFCEINSVDEKLIKPLITKSLSALNTIYQVVNCKLNTQQINLLKKIKDI